MKYTWLAILTTLVLNASISSFGWSPKPIPSKSALKAQLTKLQFEVTQEQATEAPFKNDYWDSHTEGIYVDRISGEPLFSSKDKFDSGTGWPSFTKPLSKENLVEKEDRNFFSVRTEVRSKHANSHLGHVFDDGPQPLGLRYCINSAALRFINKQQLQAEGYGEFLKAFGSEVAADKIISPELETAIFAGGCFWCMQAPFDELKTRGVKTVLVGYSGGKKENPTYEETSSGNTGHREVVAITFDPKQIAFRDLLAIFWKNIDPADGKGQFCDKGEQYTSAVFYVNDEQRIAFEASKAEIIKSGKLPSVIATQLLPAKTFYPAEEYHQSYYSKNPIRYKYYRLRCGRDKRLQQLWGTPTN
jgi:peptide methionine sulfoxide reductase msrA/msrB